MIVAEPQEPTIAVVTSGGDAMGADQAMETEHVTQAEPLVCPAVQKKTPLDVQEQKHIFMDVRPYFVGTEQPSTSGQVKDMPKKFQKIFEQQTAKKSVDKVSKLKPFLSSCLALIQDKDALAKLEALIKMLPEENPLAKKVNSVKTKFKTGHGLRMSAQLVIMTWTISSST